MNQARQTILFFSVVILSQTFFLYLPINNGLIDWFPFSDTECTRQEYFYYLSEHLSFLCLFYFIYRWHCQYIKELEIILLILVVDFIDYLLTYNSVWVYLGKIPISWNTLQILLMGYAFLKSK